MPKNLSLILALFLIVLGVASRILPHAANTTPISAIALFASAYLGLRYSLAIVVLVMFAADTVIGFYTWQIMLSVYGSFAISGFIGYYVGKNRKIGTIFAGALGASVLFFLATNWAVWQFGTLYPHSFSGLMQSYLMGLPFFKNSLIGDIGYTALLFGVFELSLRMAAREDKGKTALAYEKL